MPIMPDNDGGKGGESTLRGTNIAAEEEERPTSELIISKLNLPSNATSIRADITDGFSCDNKTYGYYADVDNECQIFHVCLPVVYADGKENTFRWSFICPEETIFSQESFTCMRAEDMNINCDDSHMYYDLNRNFGMVEESMDSGMNNENDEEIRMENNSRQPAEIASESKLEPVKDKEIPANIPVNPNRKKNSGQRRKPTPPARRATTTAYVFEEVVNAEEFHSTTIKSVVSPTYPKFTKRPPIATITNIQTHKKDQRPDLFNPKRKRPQIQQQILRDAIAEKPIVESSQTVDKLPFYPAQIQPEPRPTLKIETFFKPQTSSYHPTPNINESEKSGDLAEEDNDEIQLKDQHGHLAQASEIKEVSIKPLADLEETTKKNEEGNDGQIVSEVDMKEKVKEEVKEEVKVEVKKEPTEMESNQETEKISLPDDSVLSISEMGISQTEANAEKPSESAPKDTIESEIPLTLNGDELSEPAAEESLKTFVAIKPESIKLPAEISVPAEVAMDLSENSSNFDVTKESHESEAVKEEEPFMPAVSEDTISIDATETQQSAGIMPPILISSQNQFIESSTVAIQETKPETSQNEADSAQTLIANFISTLVNAENSKLEDKPTVTYENPMGDSLTEMEENKKETFPELIDPVAIKDVKDEEMKMQPESLEMFQIPVQIIHSPNDERPQMKFQSNTVEDELNTTNSLMDKKQNPDSGVFIPLTVDDVVELVKDRLIQNSSQPVEKEDKIAQSSEILPIYHRLPEVSSNLLKKDSSASIMEPTLVAVVSQVAPNQETEIKSIEEKPTEKENNENSITDKENIGDDSTTERQRVVLRRNVKIHKTKMDPRKRRFLFRSHSS